MFRGPAGLAALLKEGSRHYQGSEEAVFRNIDAASKLLEMLKSCLGPTGMSKLVANFLDKRFLTSDAATVVSELEVQHPAAKMLVLAAQMQATEFGDGANTTIMFGAELLHQAGILLRQGVHVASVLHGYDLALKKALELIANMSTYRLPSVTDRAALIKVITPVVGTKLKNVEGRLVELIVDSCLSVMPSEDVRTFNTDNVRVNKLVGGSVAQSFLVNGLVLAREPKTAIREKTNCKICVLANALEIGGTEGTGTVLINTTDQLMNFSRSEETEMEAIIKNFHDAGVEALIVGGHIAPLALHYLDKYDMFAIATPSKFDIKRYCRTLRVPALQRLVKMPFYLSNTGRIQTPPMAEEIGTAEFAGVQEYSSQLVTVVRAKDTKVSSIVLRGPTRALLDEIERAIDDAVSLVKATTKDARFVAGGAAVEAELAHQLTTYASTLSGLEQYAVEKFGQSFLIFGKTLAENAGQHAMESIVQLQAAHKAGNTTFGINVTRITGQVVRDMCVDLPPTAVDESSAYVHLTYPVLDHYLTKRWAIRLAADAAMTVLKVDQIIMAKPAGGPKPQNQGHWDAADEQSPIS